MKICYENLKNNSVVEKIRNYRHKWVQHVWRMDRERQIATLNYEISIMWETKPRAIPRKPSCLLTGQEQITWSKAEVPNLYSAEP
jgi:hypothetical protein